MSCPAEQRNFRKVYRNLLNYLALSTARTIRSSNPNPSPPCPVQFIDAMEAYERSSGMRVTPNERGFTVPLGPDLKAQVNFYQS